MNQARKEMEDYIERDKEEHERDFTNLREIQKCPRCGGEFEEGYITINGSKWDENRFCWYFGLKKPLTQPGILSPSSISSIALQEMPSRNV